MIAVGVPVMILAGIATYFNSRASVARQSPEAAANPQTAMMNKLALYVFPLGVVVGGPFLPLAIILYWFSNNIWTFGQQHYVFGMIEKEEEAKKQEAIAAPGGQRAGAGRQAEAERQGRRPSSGNGVAASGGEAADQTADRTTAETDGGREADGRREPGTAERPSGRSERSGATAHRGPARDRRDANADEARPLSSRLR